MTDNWDLVYELADRFGVDGRVIVDAARNTGVSAHAVAHAFTRTSIVLMDDEPLGSKPFLQFHALPPGVLDLRVLDQRDWWVDILRRPHLIADRDDFTDAYLTNVILYLREKSADIMECPHEPGYLGDDALTWLDATPLLQALRAEAATRDIRISLWRIP